MKIHELNDIVKKVRQPKPDEIKNAPKSENKEPDNLPPVPGHYGTNTVTGKGGGGIVGDSWEQNQY